MGATSKGQSELRRRAEAAVGTHSARRTFKEPANAADALRLVHELQVYQVELELQNEELERARSETEQALACYCDLYEFAPVGYLTVGTDGRIQQVNLNGARLLGQERARLVGASLRPQLDAASHVVFDRFWTALFTDDAKPACQVGVAVAGAAPRHLEFTGSTTEERQACRLVVVDITERKRLEHEHELLQAQLAQAHKMEAIGTLAGGIAHDFNNILGGVLGGLSLLEFELPADSAQRADIVAMKALVGRGANLTRQLLGFARRGKYDVRPLDLGRAVQETSSIFGRIRKDVSLHLDVASDLHQVLMDHSQLEQALLNLLVNGGQAMPYGGRLLLRAENIELSEAQVVVYGVQAGTYVRLAVTDTGCGMDAATKSRLFEPFFTTKSAEQGTGLGLASVYGIVKNHGGFITVDSELGMGTTFSLHFPAASLATNPRLAPTLSAALPEPVVRGLGTVLVVDDEPQLVAVYGRLLKKLGYDVLTAPGGREAIELVRQHGSRIRLVILDMIMPGMTGREAFDQIHELVVDSHDL